MGNSSPTTMATRAWLNQMVLATVVLVCAIPYSTNYVDPDLWGHVQYAHDWMRDGQLPRTATHTFTATGHRWINHENLSELALAIGFQWLGNAGMLALKCGVGVAISVLAMRSAMRQHCSLLVVALIPLLMAGGLHVFWLLRPQLATFCGLVAWVLLSERAFRDWTKNQRVHWQWLWLYPLVQLLWTNAHGGFLAGIGLFGLMMVGRIAEAWLRKYPARGRQTIHLVAVTCVSVAVMFVNPYGADLIKWMVFSLSNSRPEIAEWGPPDLLAPVFWPFFAMFYLAIFSLLVSRRQRDWVQVLLLVVVAWQALSHIRHIGIFVIMAAFWIPGHVQSAIQVVLKYTRFRPRFDLRAARVAGTVSLVLSLALAVPVAQRLSNLSVDRSQYPVDALQFMVDHQMQGRMVVSFNWAQYAIAALQPDVQVAFDGRFRTCYPQEIIDMHFDFLVGDAVTGRQRDTMSGPLDPARVLEYASPDYVLVDRTFHHSVEVMDQQQEFVLLYQDGVAQLWGRREKFDDPRSADYLPPPQRQLVDELPVGLVAWPALPRRVPEATDQLVTR